MPREDALPSALAILLPHACERALLERFLRAEAMALWAVRAAQTQNLPRHVQTFLQRHEIDEQDHLRQFEGMLGTTSQRAPTLPAVPSQWEMLAVFGKMEATRVRRLISRLMRSRPLVVRSRTR